MCLGHHPALVTLNRKTKGKGRGRRSSPEGSAITSSFYTMESPSYNINGSNSYIEIGFFTSAGTNFNVTVQNINLLLKLSFPKPDESEMDYQSRVPIPSRLWRNSHSFIEFVYIDNYRNRPNTLTTECLNESRTVKWAKKSN